MAKARQALAGGDFDRAVESARRAGEMLRDMKEKGKESDIVLTGMAMNLKSIADQAANASKNDELLDLENVRYNLEIIRNDIKMIGDSKIKIDMDTSEAEELLKGLLKPEEKVINIRYNVVGGVPGYGDNTSIDQATRRESDKGGYRP